ncbi:MAG: hypothetical protein MZW92_03035 [Comamonadaceae bacterium]|nr:hypothetical protein [Comamonadaceae bacterium]
MQHVEPGTSSTSTGTAMPGATGPRRGAGRSNGVVCPYCHEKDEVIPILCGFPSHEAFKKADRGELYPRRPGHLPVQLLLQARRPGV